jgi:CelD/BcsL family acetyltransferase involved in cellulose biosynthesis
LLKMLSSFHSLHGTPFLLGRNKQETMRAVFEHLRRRQESWTIWFTSYEVGDSQEAMFFSMLQELGYPFSTTPDVRSPYQRIAETWEEKLKTLQPRFRTALRSREKRLREKGAVELRFLDSSAEWEQGLAAIREIEEDSWKVEAGTAITVQDFQWQFYSRYAPIAAAAKSLRIPVLYVAGEPVAYDYALYENGIYYLLKTRYKKKWHDSYPGFVLRKLLAEWTYSQDCQEIDYLGKDEDWKMKWTDSVREHRNCYIFSRSLVARYLHGLHRAKTLLRRGG